jgi:hypothetical protein
LDKLKLTLGHKNKRVRSTSCWVVSNLLAEDDQIKLKVSRSGILQIVLNLLISDTFEIRRECLFCICNLL